MQLKLAALACASKEQPESQLDLPVARGRRNHAETSAAQSQTGAEKVWRIGEIECLGAK
jgi:hypothetical protein